ncbi:MAG: NifB/NifX family molybdenum-iron cluster-binding protein [Armatimonadota bacterium]|nr:MAG: NifB/NifX family molybdenum-iron cluster-binding protein [Armatimonadota bacterium]
MTTSRAQETAARVAISTDGEEVAAHFGRCQAYTIVEIAERAIRSREIIANPGHEPGFLPGYLAQRGVTHIVTGGMGPRAQMLFDQHGIQTIVGISGTIEETLRALLQGELESGESLCEH